MTMTQSKRKSYYRALLAMLYPDSEIYKYYEGLLWELENNCRPLKLEVST